MKTLRAFLLLTLAEGCLVLLGLLGLPGDAKHAVLYGLSLNRLALLGSVLAGVGALAAGMLRPRKLLRALEGIARRKRAARVVDGLGFLSMLLFWLLAWRPLDAYGLDSALVQRLRFPVLWLLLAVFQLFLYLRVLRKEIYLAESWGRLRTRRGAVLFALLTAGGLGVLFWVLKAYAPPGLGSSYEFFSLGTLTLSAGMVFTTWVVLVLGLVLVPPGRIPPVNRRAVYGMGFSLFWIGTAVLWSSTTFSCGVDRSGPYPPNNECYSNVNDAVYAIGSTYTRLGEGIYNHWSNDKPLYMVFLALGQVVAGPGVAQYLQFQLLVLAVVPALMFLLGARMHRFSTGLLAGILTSLQGAMAIRYYHRTGVQNARVENTEVFTALLLVLALVFVFEWLRTSGRPAWGVLAGGALGLAGLVRFNAILILPALTLCYLLQSRKPWKPSLSSLGILLLSFGLVFGPWVFTATNIYGSNMYLGKIDNVLVTRTGRSLDGWLRWLLPGPDRTSSLGEAGQYARKALPRLEPHAISARDGMDGMVFLYHFLNNVYAGFSKLPLTLELDSFKHLSADPVWSSLGPVWNLDLTPIQVASGAVNVLVLSAGIAAAWKRHRAAGLAGIVLQMGYYLGNALAVTSGNRYLEPVAWVTTLYYSIGLVALTRLGLGLFRSQPPAPLQEAPVPPQPESRTRRSWTGELLGGMLLLGLILPVVNHLPGSLPPETGEALKNQEAAILEAQGLTDAAGWDAFLQDPASQVFTGVLLQPKIDRDPKHYPENPALELMVLGKDHVFVVYSPDPGAMQPIPDDRLAVVVGCQVGADDRWGAYRILVHAQSIRLLGPGLLIRSTGPIVPCQEFLAR